MCVYGTSFKSAGKISIGMTEDSHTRESDRIGIRINNDGKRLEIETNIATFLKEIYRNGPVDIEQLSKLALYPQLTEESLAVMKSRGLTGKMRGSGATWKEDFHQAWRDTDTSLLVKMILDDPLVLWSLCKVIVATDDYIICAESIIGCNDYNDLGNAFENLNDAAYEIETKLMDLKYETFPRPDILKTIQHHFNEGLESPVLHWIRVIDPQQMAR